MRRRMLWIGVTALVVALSAATVAFATSQRSVTSSSPTPARAADPTSSDWHGTTMGGAVSVKDMQEQHAEHQADMQAWFDKYGADPSSAAAQTALDKLRTEHWNDMRELLKKYSADPATTPQGGAAGGYGAGMMGGGSGYGAGYGTGMMGGY